MVNIVLRMRPFHIALDNFTSHNACLCSKHQNFALKLKALKSTSAKISVNPDRCQPISGRRYLILGIAIVRFNSIRCMEKS